MAILVDRVFAFCLFIVVDSDVPVHIAQSLAKYLNSIFNRKSAFLSVSCFYSKFLARQTNDSFELS